MPLTKQYSDDVRRLDNYADPRDENTWSKYSQKDDYSKFEPETQPTAADPSGIERSTSLSPYPSNQSFPRGSSPTLSKHEDADTKPPAVTSSLESADSDRELELRMANLELAKTHPDTTMYYPLTTAVITSALSRTHVTLEPVHEHQPESYQPPMPGSHPTLSYSNSEFKYPPQTTLAHSYGNIGSDVRTVPSQRIDPIPSVSRGNEDLRERRARLEQELRMVEMEEQQQTVNRWSGPKSYPPVGARVPYESGAGGASPHHSGLIGQLPSYGQYPTGGVQQPQYSPHSTMTHQYVPQQPQMREYQVRVRNLAEIHVILLQPTVFLKFVMSVCIPQSCSFLTQV